MERTRMKGKRNCFIALRLREYFWYQRLVSFATIQIYEHKWGPTLMLGDKVWLTSGVPVHPTGVGWGWRQGSVQASKVPPYQTGKPSCFFYGALCMGALSCWNKKRDKPKFSKISLYDVELEEQFDSLGITLIRFLICMELEPIIIFKRCRLMQRRPDWKSS